MTTPENFNQFLNEYQIKINDYNARKKQFDDNFTELVNGVMNEFIQGIVKCETDEQLSALAESTFGANAERALEILRQTSAILENSHSPDAIEEIKTKLSNLLTKEAYPDLRKTHDVSVATPLPVTVATPEPVQESEPAKTNWWKIVKDRVLPSIKPKNAIPFVGSPRADGSLYTDRRGGRKKSKKHRKQKSRKKRTLHK